MTGAQVIGEARTPLNSGGRNGGKSSKGRGDRPARSRDLRFPDVNAFATGMKKNALVAVRPGCQRHDKEEAEAVLGHEISHVVNGDMVTLALIQGVVNTFVIFLSRVIGQVVDRTVFRNEAGHGPAFWITTIVAELVLGILATIIVLWFSRYREFRADAGGAKLAGRQK